MRNVEGGVWSAEAWRGVAKNWIAASADGLLAMTREEQRLVQIKRASVVLIFDNPFTSIFVFGGILNG